MKSWKFQNANEQVHVCVENSEVEVHKMQRKAVWSVQRNPATTLFFRVAMDEPSKEQAPSTMLCMPRATVFGVQENSEEPTSEAAAKEQI